MRRRLTALVAAVALLATVVVVLIVGRDPEPPKPQAASTAGETPTAASTDPGHSPDDGHVHIDDVDPNIDPADYRDFCSAFFVLANAYSDRVVERTPETVAAVETAADAFLAVGDDAGLTEEVRAGLDGFVADIAERPVEASTEEQGAFSTFLNSACPA